jgi:hypothetical protein
MNPNQLFDRDGSHARRESRVTFEIKKGET